MGQSRRAALVVVAALVLSPLAAGGAADAAPAVTARLTGTLLTVPSEEPGVAPEYAVQADSGELVAVDGAFPEEPPGPRFDGRVDVTRLAGATPQARLATAESLHGPLRVTSYTLSAEPAAAQAATSHRWFVAAPANFGAFAMTDSEILARIGWVAAYWEKQSNGVITDIDVPATITRYQASATSPAGGCGLTGGDFNATVQEAAAAFPGASFGGTDQLLVLMPPACSSGGTVGRGTMPYRLSFGHGYYSITKVSSSTFEWTLAHELGHNYGYGHSSLGPCATSCVSTYGDYYSVMGGVVSGKPIPPALGTVSRELQGVTDAGEVESIAGSATRRLSPRAAGSGLRSLRVSDSDSGLELLLDYRSGTGDDATTYYAGGTSSTGYRKGVVVEARFGTNAVQLVPADNDRLAMVAGDTLTIGTTTVAVTATDSDGATVRVTVPGVPEAYPEPGSVTLSSAPTAGSPVTAVLAGWNPQPDAVGYQWLGNGAPISGADVGDAHPDRRTGRPGALGAGRGRRVRLPGRHRHQHGRDRGRAGDHSHVLGGGERDAPGGPGAHLRGAGMVAAAGVGDDLSRLAQRRRPHPGRRHRALHPRRCRAGSPDRLRGHPDRGRVRRRGEHVDHDRAGRQGGADQQQARRPRPGQGRPYAPGRHRRVDRGRDLALPLVRRRAAGSWPARSHVRGEARDGRQEGQAGRGRQARRLRQPDPQVPSDSAGPAGLSPLRRRSAPATWPSGRLSAGRVRGRP